MKRKLRKSLSWLLTVAMIFSLFCGMIPTASAASARQGEYISVEYNDTSILPRTSLTIQVLGPNNQELEIIELGDIYGLGPDMTVAIQDQWIGTYEFNSASISQGTLTAWNDVTDTAIRQYFNWSTTAESATITITLKEAENTLTLADEKSELDFGYIAYEPGNEDFADINVYLNYQPVCSFNNVGITGSRANNFVIRTDEGYYFGDAVYSITGASLSGNMLTFGAGDAHTINLYFFTYEGFDVDFERTVNGVTINNDDACPSLDITFTVGGEPYSITYDGWTDTNTIYLPRDTMIYVSPNIQEGYGFTRWTANDAWTGGNYIYTLDADGNPVDTDSQIIGQSEEMAIYYSASAYDRARIYLRMRTNNDLYHYYTVSYNANGGEGEMDSQTFSEYPVYIRNNEFTKEGYTFTGWNTADDGSGTHYSPNDIYGDDKTTEQDDVILYAQWQEAGTEPTPGEEYKITVFTKELVDDPEDVPNGLDREDYTFPENNIVTVPVNSSVTLLYKLTVTGDVGANYTISDDDATLVNGYNWEGTIGDTGTAVIYVTKTFDVTKIDPADGTLTNTATIEAGEDTTLGEGVNDGEDNTEKTDAEEGAPVPPTDEELAGLFKDGAVTIHCTTAETSFNHTEVTYGLLDGGYSSTGTVTGTGEDSDPWTYTITVTPGAYVEQYSTDMAAEHELNPGQPASQKITLNWTKDTGWAVASEVPVVYTVTCDDEHGILQFDSEYHIMDLDAIKKAVVDTVDDVESADNVGIFAIYVHGTTDDNVSGTATGRFDTDEIYYDDGILGMGAGPREPDEGVAWNGYHPNDGNDYWLVQNTSESVNNDTITGITIYYKNNGTEGNVLIPYTDLDVNHLEGLSSHITEIYLHTISDEPEPEPGTYTLTYNYNDASEGTLANTETDDQKYAAGATVTLKTDVNDQYDTEDDGVVVVGWTKDQNPYTKSAPATESPDGLVTEVTFQDENITVYAAWAQDANDNGKPDYEEGFVKQNVYVYAKPTGSGTDGALTPDEKEKLEQTYNLTLNNSGYCVLGKLKDVLLPAAAEQDPDEEYHSIYARVIEAAFDAGDKFEAHPYATYDLKLIDALVWNHLSVASGAEGYEDEASSSAGLCWHLDGTLDVTVKYDLTFYANGGSFTGQADPGTLTIYDLTVGKYEIRGLTGYQQPSHTGSKVVFAGWTDEVPTGENVNRIYQAGDTDVPATVTSVTLPTTQELWAVWGYDEDEDGVADINEVVITPADITIYTGGNGYGGVTDADGDIITDTNNSGLPEPGYHIDLPANIQTWLGNGTTAENLATILRFEYNVEEGTAAGTRNWEMKYAGVYATDASGDPLRYVYTLEPSDDGNGKKIPVRILYKDGDTIVDDDKIEMSATAAHEEYTMTINPGELDQNKIQAKLTKGDESKTLNVFIGTGKLTIRSVVEKEDNTSVIAANESSVTGNEIAAVGNNASYVVNDSEVSIDVTNNADRVQLLVDKVSGNTEFDEAMENASRTRAGMSDGACETAYLDLVDTENGNTVVTLSRGSMDIYWPMPENANAEGTFKVVHYVGMDRESTVDTGDLPTLDSVQVLQGDKQVSVVTTGGQQYIKFSTDSFSPFALVYETKDPGTGPDTDPDDDKDDDDHYTGGGGNDNDSDPTGNLSIELDVNGGDDSFTFTVYLTDKDGDDLKNNFYFNGDFTGTIGSGDEITLEGGDKIVIRNLPEGTRYEVIIETADGYTYVIDGEEGIIRTGTNEAEFTATRTVPLADPSVTGVSRWLNVTDHIAYLTGYPGGAFGPDNSMTRAEVAQMFYALLNNKNVTITKTFPDVPANAWYATAVNTLASLGMVSGDANGNYRPNDPITRAEFCVIALAFAYEPDNAVCYFSDVSRSDWFYTYVAQAASYGWIGGYTNGNFGPNDRITRAQVTTIVNNMLGRAADRDYVIDHQADLVQFTDLTRAHWGYFQIMEATNAHDYTKSNGTENWR